MEFLGEDHFTTLESAGGILTTRLSTGDFSFVVLDGPHQGQECRLDRELIRIGRADWCDLILSEDPWVSSVHCECWLDKRGVRIRDMGSRNGILLENCPVFDAYVIEGTKIKIGDSTIQLKSHNKKRSISIKYQDDSGRLVGKSPEMRKIFSMLSRLSKRKVSTLLTGETGTGKTNIALSIHEQAQNKDAPFVIANCATLPSNLIEAELFGYEKGAFTGADARHDGLFLQANGGTLFLDEIAELPLELQPKLLDVLERRKVRRIGGTKEYDVDIRLISATHRNLSVEVEEGRFREDLYYRISVVELEIPALRARIEDLPLLVDKLLEDLCPGRTIRFTKGALQELKSHLWPGNVRQLRNALERSITFLEGNTIKLKDLNLPTMKEPNTGSDKGKGSDSGSFSKASGSVPSLTSGNPIALKEVLASVEKDLITEALEVTSRNVQAASKLLGISPAWMYERISKYGLGKKKR